MLYPCSFPEISCLAALEAQAAGAAILTTDGFALSETVAVPEFKVKGRPHESGYLEEFTNRAYALLTDREKTKELTRKARSTVETKYTWQAITKEWNRLFTLAKASMTMVNQAPRDAGHPPVNF